MRVQISVKFSLLSHNNDLDGKLDSKLLNLQRGIGIARHLKNILERQQPKIFPLTEVIKDSVRGENFYVFYANLYVVTPKELFSPTEDYMKIAGCTKIAISFNGSNMFAMWWFLATTAMASDFLLASYSKGA